MIYFQHTCQGGMLSRLAICQINRNTIGEPLNTKIRREKTYLNSARWGPPPPTPFPGPLMGGPQCRMSILRYGNIAYPCRLFHQMSHIEFKNRPRVTIFFSPCRMSLSRMSHVKFKKCPCRPVGFRGQGPLPYPPLTLCPTLTHLCIINPGGSRQVGRRRSVTQVVVVGPPGHDTWFMSSLTRHPDTRCADRPHSSPLRNTANLHVRVVSVALWLPSIRFAGYVREEGSVGCWFRGGSRGGGYWGSGPPPPPSFLENLQTS